MQLEFNLYEVIVFFSGSNLMLDFFKSSFLQIPIEIGIDYYYVISLQLMTFFFPPDYLHSAF